MEQEEYFIPFIDYPNYQISNLGRVKNIKNNYFINPCKNQHRDTSFCVSKDGKGKNYPLYRTLALHFLPNPQNLPYVIMINGNKDDIRLENLKWVMKRNPIGPKPKKLQSEEIKRKNRELYKERKERIVGKLYELKPFRQQNNYDKQFLWKKAEDFDNIFQNISDYCNII
jgi:hypothetical protein